LILFYLLIAIMPLTEHRIWETSQGSLTLFKWLGIACLLVAIFHLIQHRGPPPFFRSWQAGLFVFLYALVVLSYFSKTKTVQAWEISPLAGWTSCVSLFFVTLTLVDTLPRLRWVLMVLVGSLAFASLYVLREWQKYHNVYQDFRTWGGVSGDPNYFSASALIGVAVAFCLLSEKTPRWGRWLLAGCLAITLTALTIAASRGGFLGLAAAFAVIAWRSRRRLLMFSLGTVALVFLFTIAPVAPVERLLHPSPSDERATQNRKIAWQAGLRMMESAPLFGIGVGNYKAMVRQFEDEDVQLEGVAHNTYIEIGAELGLPAMAIFLAILFLNYRSLERVRRRAQEAGESFLERAAVGLQAAIVGFSVSIFFLSEEYQRHLWFLVFLSMCLPYLQPARRAPARNIKDMEPASTEEMEVEEDEEDEEREEGEEGEEVYEEWQG